MEKIQPRLLTDYRKWEKIIGDDPYKNSQCLGIFDVLKAHYMVIDFFSDLGEGVGGVGPRDINLLHSALGRQHCSFQNERKWKNEYELCATLFFG